MKLPTPISVTDVPCACDFLAGLARDATLLVRFDAQMNEYQLLHEVSRGSKVSVILYHCPRCGGVASQSRRQELFSAPPDEEVRRLESLIRDISTEEEIVRVLGSPDKDETIRPQTTLGAGRQLSSGAVPESVRVMTYSSLSATADVQFSVYGKNRVEGVIAPKHIGE